MLKKPALHSISNRLDGIKAEKYGPELITLANSFYAYQRRKRTSSSPNGKVPSLLTKFSPVERTVCGMHRTIDSSQTHGTRPDSEGSTPSAGLCVRLLTSVPFIYIYISAICLSFFLSFLFLHGLKRLKCVLTKQS